MSRGLALVLIAGCGGYSVPATPGRMNVQLVRCTAAQPPPAAAADPVLGLMGTEDGEIGLSAVGTLHEIKAGGAHATVFSFGTPSTTGTLGGGAVARVLQQRLPELQACATRESQTLASGPASSKAVVLWRFTIGATGKVILAEVTSHVLSNALTACVTGVIRGATFPAPPDGKVVQVNYPFVFDSTGAPAEPVVRPPPGVPPWTPFALDTAIQPAITGEVARAAEGAVRPRLAAIEACFAGSSQTGSLRAMLEVDLTGGVTSIRAGGLGDHAIEGCVAKALAGARVIAPRPDAAEIACDLSRGDARPWRVTLDGGYGVIEASRTRLRYGDKSIAPGSDPAALDDAKTFVVVAEPDTTGGMLSLALSWAYDGEATLVALRSPGGPVFLGMGRSHGSDRGDGEHDAPRPSLEVGGKTVTECASRTNRATPRAPLSDPAAVGALVQRIVARCRAAHCSGALVIALDEHAAVKDLVEVTAAARRAGFERVLLGGDAGCGTAAD